MGRSAPPAPGRRSRADNGSEPIPPVSSVDPVPDTWGRRTLRYGRRLLATAALGAGFFVAYAYVLEPWLGHGEETEAVEAAGEGQAAEPDQAPEPPRPDAVPERIPPWAWQLNEWHSAPGEERGPRPEGAPQQVPAWYWVWRAWRAELAGLAGT